MMTLQTFTDPSLIFDGPVAFGSDISGPGKIQSTNVPNLSKICKFKPSTLNLVDPHFSYNIHPDIDAGCLLSLFV